MMIRLFVALLLGITFFSIYYDLTQGTIPSPKEDSIPASNIVQLLEDTDTIIEEDYVMIEVMPGDTVLTIVERITNGPLPVTVPQLIHDFELLNDNVTPEKIQIGKTYKFPVYH